MNTKQQAFSQILTHSFTEIIQFKNESNTLALIGDQFDSISLERCQIEQSTIFFSSKFICPDISIVAYSAGLYCTVQQKILVFYWILLFDATPRNPSTLRSFLVPTQHFSQVPTQLLYSHFLHHDER